MVFNNTKLIAIKRAMLSICAQIDKGANAERMAVCSSEDYVYIAYLHYCFEIPKESNPFDISNTKYFKHLECLEKTFKLNNDENELILSDSLRKLGRITAAILINKENANTYVNAKYLSYFDDKCKFYQENNVLKPVKVVSENEVIGFILPIRVKEAD